MELVYPENFGMTKKRYAGKKVAVLLEMRSNEQNVNIDGFEFDLDRLDQTLAFIETQRSNLLQNREYLRFHINKMILEGQVRDEFFRTLIINYLATYATPRKLFKKLPAKSLGFMVCINANEKGDPGIVGMGYEDFARCAEKILAKYFP